MKVESITTFTLYMIEIGQCRWSHDGPWLCELIDTDAPRIQAEEIEKGYNQWLKAKKTSIGKRRKVNYSEETITKAKTPEEQEQ